MLVSLNQLGRWVDIDGIDPVELAERLTMVGLEVESVEFVGRGHEQIVVGRIDAIEEHPKADRLVVCRVDVGDGRLRQIVCGASNMVAGDYVPVALPGSSPPALDFEIGARPVAGIDSEGMLCAEEELGLAAKSDGLMILSRDLRLGTPIFSALGLEDVRYEVGLTPNRPDCLSHRGVAREVAALYARELKPLDTASPWESDAAPIAEAASLRVDDRQGCPRYVAAVLEGVEVGPSPAWLRTMVQQMGMRSINNLVDVTNVVLADIGQPLHVFDLDKLSGAEVVVRRAAAGEKLLGIDHKEYELDAADLVIADRDRPVAIAGVMGGADTEVEEGATRILLECAYFQPSTVRLSSKRLGLHTESSHRFERGIDWGATREHAAYALAMILRTQNGATVRHGLLEVDATSSDVVEVTVDRGHAERILGLEFSAERIAELMKSIDVSSTTEGDSVICRIPSFRPDLERPIDIIEEVARLHGYDEFEATLPAMPMGDEHALHAAPKHGPTIVTRARLRELDRLRTRLRWAGMYETVSFSFISMEELDQLGLEADDVRRDAPRVANPLTREHELMRTTMVPGLLRALQTNVAQRESDVALFEIGRTYQPDQTESNVLAVLVTGRRRRHFAEPRSWDFYDLKGVVESLRPQISGTSSWRRPDVAEPHMHPGVQAEWWLDGRRVAHVGQMHPALMSAMDVSVPVFFAEVNLDELQSAAAGVPTFAPLTKFPSIRRDFALLCDRSTDWASIEAAIAGLGDDDPEFAQLFESLHLFDVYEGSQVPEGKRSIAVQVVYRAADRTLTDEEVGRADRQLIDRVSERTGATLR